MTMIEPQANGTGNGHSTATTTGSGGGPRSAVGVNPENLAFVEELYYQWQGDPGAVDPAWRSYFESLDDSDGSGAAPVEAGVAQTPLTFHASTLAATGAPQ